MEAVETQAALALDVTGDGVAWLVFDKPASRVNILTTPILIRLNELLGEIEAGVAAGRVRAVVVRSGKDGSFIAGADVNEIATVTEPTEGEAAAARGQALFSRLERLTVPTVAAVDGLCLGGGTELILACDVRIASNRPETKIGLPEIRLGIIPGFGGTTRLPRLIGLSEALPMILTGSAVPARKALRIGLVSEAVHPKLLYERAHALAVEMATGEFPPRPARALLRRVLDGTAVGRQVVMRQARKQVMKETGGHYPAPLRALDVVRQSYGLPLDRALDIEARALGSLIATDVSKNLIRVFQLMEGAKKAGPAGVKPLDVERVAVLGAGVMGGGIAQLLAYRGLGVRLKDIRPEALALGLRHAREMFDRLVKRGRMSRQELEHRMDAISPTLDYTGFRNIDVVIEAVVEKMNVKQQVLREAEANVSADCVLATNTSSLSITDMQKPLDRPERLAGMHFFNPVHRMPLVEVIRGAATSDETIATVTALAKRLEKTPVLVNDGPGFLVNRVLAPYLNEAGWLVGDGADIEHVDRTLKRFGMPMGPLRLLDEVGLDIAHHAGNVMFEAFGARLAPPPALTAIEGTRLLGRKVNRGFYAYENGREKEVNPDIRSLLGLPAVRDVPAREILDRTLLAMVNEAARILEDGIVAEPGDVDLGMITGTGFPPFRGGLLRWADTLGTREILHRLEQLRGAHGVRFEPAPLIRKLAAADRGFHS